MWVYRYSRMSEVGLWQHRDCLSVKAGLLQMNDSHGSSLDPHIGILTALTSEEQINNLFGKNHFLYPLLLSENIDVELEHDERDQNPPDWIPESHS